MPEATGNSTRKAAYKCWSNDVNTHEHTMWRVTQDSTRYVVVVNTQQQKHKQQQHI
jgi:hypothetical protein